MHLILDGTLAQRPSRAQVEDLLKGLVSVIGMTLIAGPFIEEAQDKITGFVLIAESHICLHIYGVRAFLDIFSCKPFCWETAERYVWGELAPKELTPRVLVREIGKTAWACHV